MPQANFTLRLDILRDAYDQYIMLKNAAHATETERLLYALKAMECEAMIKELNSGE